MVHSNGDTYIGEFLNNKAHGFGKYSQKSGEVYEGQWKLDKPNGKG